MKKWLLLFIPSFSFAFFPFEAEDAGTLGGLGNFQFETNYANFKYYSGARRQVLDFQFQAGLLKNMDLAVIQPYVKLKEEGQRLSGADDLRIFIKHIPFEVEGWRAGYRVQLNLDTGKEGIGYGRTTANVNLIAEKDVGNITLNLNAVYIKSSHVEGLRDAYGVIFHLYGKPAKWLTLGGEIKYIRPEHKVSNKDTHLLVGFLLHPTKSIDLSFGVHKSLNKHQEQPDYGFLTGFLYRF
ncbi:MAG: hypothetical protein WKI49_03035 [Aquificaceae bacterium]